MVSQPKISGDSLDAATFSSAEQLAFLPELVDTTEPSNLDVANSNYATGTNLGLKTAAYLSDGSRDEMNLAEFPLAVLSSRSNPNIKTLEFSDTQRLKTGEIVERKWTITAADKFGLPTSTDDDVVLGLMQLTKDQGFRNRKIYFTRYELLKALRWSTEGRSYGRLTKSLDRLSGVRIRAANAFYDNSTKAYQTVNFGLIDAYEINDSRGGADHEQPKSFFIWSEKLFDSFKSGFIKKLDLDLYFSLRSAVSRRMYRYLDKHTYYRSTIERHLMSFAFDKLGLSRTYKFVSSVKQQVEPACQELKSVGFLDSYEFFGSGKDTFIRFAVARNAVSSNVAPFSASTKNTGAKRADGVQTPEMDSSHHERARQESDARRRVGDVCQGVFPKAENHQARSLASSGNNSVPPSSDPGAIRNALISKGMTAGQVVRLLCDKTGTELDRISAIIEYFDKRMFANSNKNARNPIGLLYRAVESPFSFVLPDDAPQENNYRNNAQLTSGRSRSPEQKRSLRPELKVVRAVRTGKEKQVAEIRKDESETSRQRDSFRTYERFLELEIAKMKASMCAHELTELYSKVQQKMSCLSAVLSEGSLRESTERCFEEEIRKSANIPDFRSWLKGE